MFYDHFYARSLLAKLSRSLDIGAGGQQLPYSGYVETNIAIPGLLEEMSCRMLIVPDTRYAQRVPVILGTNILKSVMDKPKQDHGVRYLQKLDLHGSWHLAFKCLCIQHHKVERSKCRLCVMKSAVAHKVVIPVNGTVTISGKMDKQVYLPPCIGITEQCIC